MAEIGDLGFCGNPFNHSAHDILGDDNEPIGYCAGVGRQEVTDTIVEKYSPELSMAEDGTSYVKVTVFVEDLKTGDTDIITCERASRPMTEVKAEEYVPMHYVTRNFTPKIEKVSFSFRPEPLEDGVAFTIEKKDKDGNPRT